MKAPVRAAVWTVYILECADGTLYTGMTNDLAARMTAHASGKGARYTRGRGPFRIVRAEEHATRGAALSREAAIKTMGRKAKLLLCGQRPGGARTL